MTGNNRLQLRTRTAACLAVAALGLTACSSGSSSRRRQHGAAPPPLPPRRLPRSVAATTAAAGASTAATSAVKAPTGKPLVIGASVSLTGDFSDSGKAVKTGYDLWAAPSTPRAVCSDARWS